MPLEPESSVWIRVQHSLSLAALAVPMVDGRSPVPFPGRTSLGVTLLVLGGWIGVAAVRALGRHRTPSPVPRREGGLVRSGIYARVRHPLYVSLVVCGVGWAVLWGSVGSAGLVFVLALWLDRKATLEERLMQARFPDYASYRETAGKYLPRMRAR